MVADLVAQTRRERDQRARRGQDVGWLDRVLAESEPVAEQTHDLEIATAIRRVVERHGPGPYPPHELATIAGVDADELRRVLDRLVAEGLAMPPDEPLPPSSA